MQLDRTHIVIRQRQLPELADLSILLLQRYPWPLFVSWLLGALPFMLLNAGLTLWIIWSDQRLGLVDDEAFWNRIRYVWDYAVLTFLQAPLAGVLTTYFLGQAVFEENLTWRGVFGGAFGCAHRWLWTLGCVRGPFAAMLLMLLLIGSEFSPGVEVFLFTLLLIWAASLRGLRPFLPEILLLERCRFRSRKKAKHATNDVITVSKRTGTLHAPASGNLVGRFIAVAAIAVLLTGALFYGMLFARGIFAGNWRWNLTVFGIFLPLSMWLVVGVTNIIRLLGYLDTRIRLEGWEVELALRAEALRQNDALGLAASEPQREGVA